jgi:hypothetical protein
MLESEDILKFNISFLTGRVIDVEPITFDSDTGDIWEQDILFQLNTGITIPLSDNDLGCKKEDIGQEKSIQIATAFRTSIEICGNSNSKMGIFPNRIYPGHSPKICGVIKKIVEPSEERYKQFRRYATLDVGIGQILLVLFKDHKEDFSIFHEGDCVSFTGRLDVLNVR